MRQFLFLQGPLSPFFAEVAEGLAKLGHGVHQIQVSFGDRLFWPLPNAVRFNAPIEGWPAFIEAFYARYDITDLVLLGEQRIYHKIAIQLAQQRCIAVTVTDFGYLRPDWLTWERDGMSGNSRFPRQPAQIRALAARCPAMDMSPRFSDSFWSMARWDMLYHLSNFFLGWTFPHYHNHQEENPVLVYIGTGLRLLRARLGARRAQARWQAMRAHAYPIYLYPLQMAKDFSIRAYSSFGDQADAIEQVIASFARYAPPNAQLFVKIHPWDPGLRSWRRITQRAARRQGVEGRVHYVDGGDLNAMAQWARGMVTINSTAGMQALRFGCPVKTLGQAIYDVNGLTFQGSLDAFWQESTPPDQALLHDFLAAMAATIQIRGVFYARPGLDCAVDEAVRRLHEDRVNQVMPT